LICYFIALFNYRAHDRTPLDSKKPMEGKERAIRKKRRLFVCNFSTLNKTDESLTLLNSYRFVNLVVQSLVTTILIYWLCFGHCYYWFHCFSRKENNFVRKNFMTGELPFHWIDPKQILSNFTPNNILVCLVVRAFYYIFKSQQISFSRNYCSCFSF
jgi:hypothetical protein